MFLIRKCEKITRRSFIYLLILIFLLWIHLLIDKEYRKPFYDLFPPFPVIDSSEMLFINGSKKSLGDILGIYIINLPERIDRRTESIALIQRLGLQAYLVPAYSSNSSDIIIRDRLRSHRFLFNKNEFACWASHMRLWTTLANDASKNNNDSWALIFEDDVDLELNLVDIINRFPCFIWKQADLIYLGHCANPPGQLIYRSFKDHYRIHRALHPSCTHAYAVRLNALDQLVVLLAKPVESIDNALVRLIEKNSLVAFSIHPPLAIQKIVSKENPSNINQVDRESWIYRFKFYFYRFFQWLNGVELDQKLRQSTLQQSNRIKASLWRQKNEKGVWLNSHNVSMVSFQ